MLKMFVDVTICCTVGGHCVQFVIDQECLPVFAKLLTHHKTSIQKEAAWMISNVTAGNATQIQAVIDAGLIPLVLDIIAKVTGSLLVSS